MNHLYHHPSASTYHQPPPPPPPPTTTTTTTTTTTRKMKNHHQNNNNNNKMMNSSSLDISWHDAKRNNSHQAMQQQRRRKSLDNSCLDSKQNLHRELKIWWQQQQHWQVAAAAAAAAALGRPFSLDRDDSISGHYDDDDDDDNKAPRSSSAHHHLKKPRRYSLNPHHRVNATFLAETTPTGSAKQHRPPVDLDQDWHMASLHNPTTSTTNNKSSSATTTTTATATSSSASGGGGKGPRPHHHPDHPDDEEEDDDDDDENQSLDGTQEVFAARSSNEKKNRKSHRYHHHHHPAGDDSSSSDSSSSSNVSAWDSFCDANFHESANREYLRKDLGASAIWNDIFGDVVKSIPQGPLLGPRRQGRPPLALDLTRSSTAPVAGSPNDWPTLEEPHPVPKGDQEELVLPEKKEPWPEQQLVHDEGLLDKTWPETSDPEGHPQEQAAALSSPTRTRPPHHRNPLRNLMARCVRGGGGGGGGSGPFRRPGTSNRPETPPTLPHQV